ncbi:hypothetical protein JYU34_020384 [Plutella xylostella]|uniref:Uncharacterized protein n=1 Tax=Plutella xylostella TaxID=51655 RepID=A0ABQ7PUC8_PLUXY|nr:hypothetical protein JYU34_020384 [Plutella xylostella]
MMPHADYLSRNPPTTNQVHNIEKPRNWAQIAQSADEETIGLIEKLRDGNLDPRQYVCQNDILYYRYTPVVRDVAVERSQPNREALREMCRTRANELLKRNQERQDAYVNRDRRPPRVYKINDLVFVIKFSQSTGKLDPGMRGPYKVTKVLPSNRYELKLLSGGYGKTTQAAAEYMVPWRGEWCPDTCAAFFASEYEQ